MSELATLRRLRATNAKLMKGNLALLTAIRETDCAIEDDWRELQACCARLEQRGLHIPASCLALMGAADPASPRHEGDTHHAVDQDMMETPEQSGAAAEREETKPTSSVLSVRSVLNAASSSPSDEDTGNDDTRSDDTRDSVSDNGSA